MFQRLVEDPTAAGLLADDALVGATEGGAEAAYGGNGHQPVEELSAEAEFGLASGTELGGAPGMGPRLGAG
jgi:hypothetical protein